MTFIAMSLSASLEKNEHGLYEDNYITDLYHDKNGIIWVGTEKGGLFVVDPVSENYNQYFAQNDDKDSDELINISQICADKYENIWVGTFGEGLYCIKKGREKNVRIQASDPQYQLSSDIIRSIYRSSNGTLWVGTHKGIQELVYDSKGNPHFSFNYGKGRELVDELQNSVVLSIVEKDNILWIGTENDGLFQIDLNSKEIQVFRNSPIDQKSICGNSIWSLFEDRAGSIWIGTYLRSISKIDPLEEKFQHINQLMIGNKLKEFGLTSSFAEDKKGNLWIGSDGGGLFYYDKAKNKYTHYCADWPQADVSSNYIVSLLIDSKENLWVGTWNGGVDLLKKGEEVFEHWQHDENKPGSISNNDIHGLMEDREGRIWISTFRKGMNVYLPRKDKIVQFNHIHPNWSLENGKIKTLVEDLNGNIWMGTEARGLHRLKLNEDLDILESKEYLSKNDSGEFSGVMINHLFVDSYQNLWIATSGNGFAEAKYALR